MSYGGNSTDAYHLSGVYANRILKGQPNALSHHQPKKCGRKDTMGENLQESRSDRLRQRLRASGRFSLVEITPIASEAQASNLQACGGCDIQLARRIGAELAITGTVQKVSNLILNMNIYVRDASSGATIAAMSADMRGNTDETWSRTLDWLVRNRLLAPGYGLQR
jgi:hypothetical protein